MDQWGITRCTSCHQHRLASNLFAEQIKSNAIFVAQAGLARRRTTTIENVRLRGLRSENEYNCVMGNTACTALLTAVYGPNISAIFKQPTGLTCHCSDQIPLIHHPFFQVARPITSKLLGEADFATLEDNFLKRIQLRSKTFMIKKVNISSRIIRQNSQQTK